MMVEAHDYGPNGILVREVFVMVEVCAGEVVALACGAVSKEKNTEASRIGIAGRFAP